MANPSDPDGGSKLGILAGRGDLPVQLIQSCRDAGRAFFVIAFDEQTPPETVVGVDHAWVRLGAAGKTLKTLRNAGVSDLVMAGGIKRPTLKQLSPDMWALKFFAKSGASALGDDGLLSALVGALEGEGFRVVGADDLLPSLLAPKGVYGVCSPNDVDSHDMRVGFVAAKELGARDIGQGVVVRSGTVIAEEDASGTDAMLSGVSSGGGGVLVKVSKPEQEGRADLPTIGPATVASAVRAGLAGIAVEAGHALVLDRDGTVHAADAAGLFVMGIEDPQ